MSSSIVLLIVALVVVDYGSLMIFMKDNKSPILGICLVLQIIALIALFIVNNKYKELNKQYRYGTGKRDIETKIRNLEQTNIETEKQIKLLGEQLRNKKAELEKLQGWINDHSEFKGGIS